MKLIITIILTVALFWLPSISGVARPEPPAVATCIVAVIGVAVCGVVVYGLYRMCQSIPDPNAPPPEDIPPVDPPLIGQGPPTIMHPLPPLKLRNQILAARVSVQHSDGAGWQTDYTFALTPSQIGGLAMVAYDAHGIPVMTNDVPLVSYQGQNWAGFDFTSLPQPVVTNAPTARYFRLLSQ